MMLLVLLMLMIPNYSSKIHGTCFPDYQKGFLMAAQKYFACSICALPSHFILFLLLCSNLLRHDQLAVFQSQFTWLQSQFLFKRFVRLSQSAQSCGHRSPEYATHQWFYRILRFPAPPKLDSWLGQISQEQGDYPSKTLVPSEPELINLRPSHPRPKLMRQFLIRITCFG